MNALLSDDDDRDLVPRGATDIRLFDARDLPWIGTIVEELVACTGQPWRVFRERVEHGPVGTSKADAIVAALRRVLAGRAERIRIARKVRGLVLGPPVLDAASHTGRLELAAEELGLDAPSVAELLWIDLANERPVTLPDGRPDERRLAAYANLDKLQSLVRRARSLRLRVWGDAHELIRVSRRLGLVARISLEGDATVLDLLGPLSLFHATTVYGRALAQLMPLLADHPRFELALECTFGWGPGSLRLAPPVLLPPVPAERGTPSHAARLAKQLGKLGADVVLDPEPLRRGCDVLYPDLAITVGERRWLVELVGFATADSLAAKRARYRAAGIEDVVLCVDEARAPEASASECIYTYASKLTGSRLLDILARAP